MAGGIQSCILLQVLIKIFTIENVNAHGSQIALWFCRLLLEFHDTAFGIAIHDTKARCLFPGYTKYTNGNISLASLMCCQHLCIIHGIDMVTRKNQHIIWIYSINKVEILINCICCALVPVSPLIASIWWQNKYTARLLVKVPCVTGAKISMKLQRTILSQYTNCSNTGISAIRKREIDNTILSTKWNCWLSNILGEGTKAAALATCQNHC